MDHLLVQHNDRGTCLHCPASRDGCEARWAGTHLRCCSRCAHADAAPQELVEGFVFFLPQRSTTPRNLGHLPTANNHHSGGLHEHSHCGR